MTQRALVTGSGGFVGRHVIAALTSRGFDVATVGPGERGGAHYRLDDVADSVGLEAVVRRVRPHRIFHLAGISRSATVAEFYRVNTVFAAALLDAVERSVKDEAAIVLMGSAAEYGRVMADDLPLDEHIVACPDSHYGISKHAQTMLGLAAARRGLRVVVARGFNILGSGLPTHLALADFAQQIARIEAGQRMPPLMVGNLNSLRDFVSVHDVAAALVELTETEQSFGKVVDLCSGQPTRMLDLLHLLIEVSGCDIPVKVDPARYMAMDIPVSYGSGTLLKTLTGRRLTLNAPAICAEILADARQAIRAGK